MAKDRMQRQRFELKYLVDETTALNIREVVRSHLDVDESGVGKPDFAYRVNSLYLDSPGLHTFWEWVNANRNRFKLRMRFYDSHPDTPVFLEIKRRVGGCILKQRCGIRKEAAPLVAAGQIPMEQFLVSQSPRAMDALTRFISVSTSLQAVPKALVTYMREAYVDPVNDGVRVTLDRHVRIAPRESCDFGLHMDEYAQPFGDRVILELKFNNRYPNWFSQMVQQFDLTRSAAAKYCEGVASLWRPQFGNCAPCPTRGIPTITV